MKNRLRFILTSKPHPYPQYADSEQWGSIVIELTNSQETQQLLYIEWDLLTLAKWWSENETFFDCECPREKLVADAAQTTESLAQTLNRLRRQEFSDDEEDMADEWFDTLYQFCEHHSLRFAMRGASLPEIIIGCNFGDGEISVSNDLQEWSYSFDMNDFLHSMRKQLEQIH